MERLQKLTAMSSHKSVSLWGGSKKKQEVEISSITCLSCNVRAYFNKAKLELRFFWFFILF